MTTVKCKTCGHVQYGPDISNSDIMTMVTGYFGISENQLKSKHRQREIVYPRQVAMYLLRNHKHHSIGFISKMFDRHHTTVLYSIHTLMDLMHTDPKVMTDVGTLTEVINKLNLALNPGIV